MIGMNIFKNKILINFNLYFKVYLLVILCDVIDSGLWSCDVLINIVDDVFMSGSLWYWIDCWFMYCWMSFGNEFVEVVKLVGVKGCFILLFV